MFDPNLMIAPNVGGMIQQGIGQGQQQAQQNMAKAAMAALVRDPTNAHALSALAGVDPERAMEFRKQQLQYGDKTHEEWAKTIGMAAKEAKTPQMWDQIVDHFVASGHPEAAQLKGQFSPALRAAYMAQGGVADDAPHNPQLVPFTQGGGVAAYDPETRGLNVLVQPNEGDHPTGAPAANAPHVTDEATYNAVPPGSQYVGPDGHIRVKQGGQTPPASGNFSF